MLYKALQRHINAVLHDSVLTTVLSNQPPTTNKCLHTRTPLRILSGLSPDLSGSPAAHWAQAVTQGGMAEQGDKRMTEPAAVQGADSLDEEVQAKVLEQQEREVLQAI
ncbi:hypothetical protein HaLaN_04069, partial [Haematococcus lacustris]